MIIVLAVLLIPEASLTSTIAKKSLSNSVVENKVGRLKIMTAVIVLLNNQPLGHKFLMCIFYSGNCGLLIAPGH